MSSPFLLSSEDAANGELAGSSPPSKGPVLDPPSLLDLPSPSPSGPAVTENEAKVCLMLDAGGLEGTIRVEDANNGIRAFHDTTERQQPKKEHTSHSTQEGKGKEAEPDDEGDDDVDERPTFVQGVDEVVNTATLMEAEMKGREEKPAQTDSDITAPSRRSPDATDRTRKREKTKKSKKPKVKNPQGSSKRRKKRGGKAKEAVCDDLLEHSEKPAREDSSDWTQLLHLPEEVLLAVLSFLPPPDLVRLSQTCRLLHLLSREPIILRSFRDRRNRLYQPKKPLFIHPAYYALDQPRFTLAQLASYENPSVVLDSLVEDGFFFVSLNDHELQIVRDMKAAVGRFLSSSESLDAMSRRSMLYLKTAAAGYAEAPEVNSFQTTITHHRWFPWPDATPEDKEVATRYWRLMARITVVLLTNVAKHLGIPMSVMELLLFSKRKVASRYGEESLADGHVQWSCDLCTLVNPAGRRTCAACHAARPRRPEPDIAEPLADGENDDDGGLSEKSEESGHVRPVESAFEREAKMNITDDDLDRLSAPTLKFYRFRELEKRRKDEWRKRHKASLHVIGSPRERSTSNAQRNSSEQEDSTIQLNNRPDPNTPTPKESEKQDRTTLLGMTPCNAMFKLVSVHSSDPDLCHVELSTYTLTIGRVHRLPLSRIARENDIAVFPSWSLRTFCAPLGIRFANREAAYRIRSRVVNVHTDNGTTATLIDPEAMANATIKPSSDEIVLSQRLAERDQDATKRGTRNRSWSLKGKEKRDAPSKEARRDLIRQHKKHTTLLEFDAYIPPPKLVRCMKRAIFMMKKDGHRGVMRWYSKKRGRIIEACPWSRYYPSSSDSGTESDSDDDDDDDDSSEDWDSSLSSESLTENEEDDAFTDSDDEDSRISHNGRLSSSLDGEDQAKQGEARLADFVYWNGPMPLTKQELRERKKRDRRKRRLQKAKKVALTTAFVAAVPVTIVTAPLWIPIGGALILGWRYRRY